MPQLTTFYKTFIGKLLLVQLVIFMSASTVWGQENRIEDLRNRFADMAIQVPALNQKIEMDITGASVKDFLLGIARTYKLNINVAPDINKTVSNHFSNVTVAEVLLYLAKQESLAYNFLGSIINVSNYVDPRLNMPPPPKIVKANFDKSTQLLTLDLNSDTLENVAKEITRLSNINVIVLPAAFRKLVSGYYQAMPVPNLLEKLAIANQLKLIRTNDLTFILSPLQPDEEIVTRQDDIVHPNYMIRKVLHNGPNGQPGSSSTIDAQQANGQKLLSLNVVNTPIEGLVKNISEQAGVDYLIYSKLDGNITAEIHSKPYETVLNNILMGTPYSFAKNGNTYMIGEKSFEGIRTQQLIELKYRSVDSLLPMMPAEYTRNVSIKEFKELNAFLVSGSQPQIDEIADFVKKIDKKVPMVMLEVIIMDVNKSNSISTGIKAGVSDSSVTTGGSLLGGGINFTMGSGSVNKLIDQIGLNNVFNIGHVTPSFYLQLQALEEKNNVDIRQTPKLSTLNGHTASLSIGSTRYYSVSTQNTIGSLTPSTIETQQFFPVEANLTLDVKPFVSGDDNVTLNLDINISDFTANTPINQPPPTSTSKFKSIIRVKDGDMILLGGIERNEKSDGSSGVPLLSRIPVLKWLFSSKTHSVSKVVSVVFIKPTIIYN